MPGWLDEVFRRCYTRRERRYGSAGEVLEAIEAAVAESPADPSRHADWLAPVRERGVLRCRRCKGTVSEEDQFCIHCGQQLVAHIPRCPSCHAYVARTDNFCIFCGTDLRSELQTRPPAP